MLIAHSLRAEGFDASEDGTGRGTPLVPVAHAFDARQSGVVQYGDMTGPLDTDGHSVAVAIHPHVIGRSPSAGPQGKEYIDDGGAYCMDSSGVPQSVALLRGIDYQHNGHTADEPTGPLLKGSPTGGGCPLPALAFAQNQLGEVRCADVTNTLNTNSNASGRNTPLAQTGTAVRRLTPRECERLQGFPDDYTLIPYRGKPAADGPRYKALGNSMAVPVMRWIGKRLTQVQLC